MIKNNYNYILNGINHEIEIKSNIKINQEPIDEIILISNKFMLKFINDLFNYNSIDYCLIGQSLLGYKVFSGINIFHDKLEVIILKNNKFKIEKLNNFIHDNNFNINYFENFIEINTVFFLDYKCKIYIYLLDNIKQNLILEDEEKNIFYFDFYDIFPISNKKLEEYEISVPNKIDILLNKMTINTNVILFDYKMNVIQKKNKDKIIYISNTIIIILLFNKFLIFL